jgi:transposase, IS6 family
MNMIRKGQVNGIDQGGTVSQVRFVEALFGVTEDDEIDRNRLS